MFTSVTLRAALTFLGDLLTERGQSHAVVVIGGGSLLLLGMGSRPTKDLDIVARVTGEQYEIAEPLPSALADAIVDTARALNLDEHWLNAGPSDLLRFGLPSGFESRVTTQAFGGLTLKLASRYDQVHFKLYAAVDQGPNSKHFSDLKKLAPTNEELSSAAAWCITHDVSDGFREMMNQTLAAFGASRV